MVPFEGAEKKCELIVSQAIDLRELPRTFWSDVVAACEAEVLSSVHNTVCDAYLLSESSLFVWSDRLLLITCGRTKLVRAIHVLLDHLPAEHIEHVLFQRKNEYFSELQHTSFAQDVATLEQRLVGTTIRFGRLESHYTELFHLHTNWAAQPSDRTYELLMYHLSPEATATLTQASLTADALRNWLQLDALIPGAQVDDYVFTPYGYSLNAIRGRDYLTIHITPEREGSYMSLETNLDLAERLAIPLAVLAPGSFDLVMYNPASLDAIQRHVPSRYALAQRQNELIAGGYHIEFAHYEVQQP